MRGDAACSEVTLDFGGVTVNIALQGWGAGLFLPKSHRPFLVRSVADTCIKVFLKDIFEIKFDEYIFNTHAIWSLGLWKDRIVIQANAAGQKPHHVLLLQPDYFSGELFCVRDTWLKGGSVFYPLAYPLDMLLVIHRLTDKRGILVHAAGVMYGGSCSLFVGHSGAGKSTMARLWGARSDVTLLNDDRILLRQDQGGFWAHGTPWHGDVQQVSPQRAPVRGIYFLEHAEKNRLTPLKPLEAASRLLVCSFLTHWDEEGMASSLGFIDELVGAVPCYEFGFVPGADVVDFLQCLNS